MNDEWQFLDAGGFCECVSSRVIGVDGLNVSAAKGALENDKLNYGTKVMSNRYQTVEKGMQAANAAAVKSSENRAEDFAKGQAEQSGRLQNELQGRQRVAQKTGKFADIDAAPGQKKAGKSQGGVFGGDANVRDYF